MNISLIKDKKIAHVNRKGQVLFRKQFLKYLKENANELHNLNIDEILIELKQLSNSLEEKIFDEFVGKEDVKPPLPVFDYEI